VQSTLFIAPLIAAHLATPVHTREVRAQGVVVRVAADANDHHVSGADLDVSGRGAHQRIHLGARDASAAALLGSISVIDANFDGHSDIVVRRDAVYLWDAKTARYTPSTTLARALSDLDNPTFDATRRTITTREVGPASPSRVTYVVEGDHLRAVESCRFINPIDPHVGTLIRTHGAESTYTKLRLSPFDVDPCGP
jgi:hypothetical protein